MKKILLTFIPLILCSTLLNAQRRHGVVEQLPHFDKQPVHWGYFLGFNQYDFKFAYEENPPGGDVLVDTSLGFNVGLIGNLRINSFLDLRFEPGLYYTRRVLNFQNPGFTESQSVRELNSTYIHLPLLLKVSSKRWGNVRPFLVGGVSTSVNLGSQEKSVDDNSSGVFRMVRGTNYYELGIGIDFYTPTFKFSPSIRGVFALTDEMKPDADPNSPWTGNIEYIQTRGVFINFTFE
ncbi:Outer membrane protein beta-barrel domain-containing protein [Pustulibacterium marinum]|uniref:Outer membrane protein beta-barrel domain-containing protein n=1 Tax=Pustulibacterium marinum TaxID=1224947 RepID=A0A1I7G706_9FLAO|nr:porin family protein [Pustulibacterium marinum]SFU44234.1 Outer membrane protein beta-barrel domain-containing protein [Pustulibacterium marinum]